MWKPRPLCTIPLMPPGGVFAMARANRSGQSRRGRMPMLPPSRAWGPFDEAAATPAKSAPDLSLRRMASACLRFSSTTLLAA